MKINVDIKTAGTNNITTEICELDIIELASRGIEDVIYEDEEDISKISVEDVMKKLRHRFQFICYTYIKRYFLNTDCVSNVGKIWSKISTELESEIKKQLNK